jgi:hypothetical protein
MGQLGTHEGHVLHQEKRMMSWSDHTCRGGAVKLQKAQLKGRQKCTSFFCVSIIHQRSKITCIWRSRIPIPSNIDTQRLYGNNVRTCVHNSLVDSGPERMFAIVAASTSVWSAQVHSLLRQSRARRYTLLAVPPPTAAAAELQFSRGKGSPCPQDLSHMQAAAQ